MWNFFVCPGLLRMLYEGGPLLFSLCPSNSCLFEDLRTIFLVRHPSSCAEGQLTPGLFMGCGCLQAAHAKRVIPLVLPVASASRSCDVSLWTISKTSLCCYKAAGGSVQRALGTFTFQGPPDPFYSFTAFGGIIPFREFYPVVWLYKVNGIKCCLKLSLCLSTALN